MNPINPVGVPSLVRKEETVAKKFRLVKPKAPPVKPKERAPTVPVCLIQIQRADTNAKIVWYDMAQDGQRLEFTDLEVARDTLLKLLAAGTRLRYRVVRIHEEV